MDTVPWKYLNQESRSRKQCWSNSTSSSAQVDAAVGGLKASAPDIRRIGAQGADSSLQWSTSPRLQKYCWPGRQRLPHPQRKLVATLCKSPLLDQTFVRFFKMKEHSGNKHCAALGPTRPGILPTLRHIEAESWQQLGIEVTVKEQPRLTLSFDLWRVREDRSLDSLRVLAVRPTTMKHIEPTIRKPHVL